MTLSSSLELQIHQSLYRNIYLLTYAYPATPEFRGLLTEDMFMNHNKVAFEQIVYFLLNILDPEEVKNKIPWPLLDKKMESDFRVRVCAYLNTLNEKYDVARLPNVLRSQFAFPGPKIVRLLWRLSELVLQQHLTRYYESKDDFRAILLPMTATKNPQKTTDLKNLVGHKISAVNEKQELRQKIVQEQVDSVNEVLKKYTLLLEEVGRNEIKLKTVKEVFEKEHRFELDAITNFENDVQSLTNINDSFKKCLSVLSLVKEGHGKELSFNSLEVPRSLKEHSGILNENNQIPLIDFLESVNLVIKQIINKFPNRDVGTITELAENAKAVTENLNDTVEKYKNSEGKLTEIENDFKKIIDEFNNVCELTTVDKEYESLIDSPPIEFNLPERQESAHSTSSKTSFKTPFTDKKYKSLFSHAKPTRSEKD